MLSGLLEIVLLAGLVWGAPHLGVWLGRRYKRRHPARGRHHAGAPLPAPEPPPAPELTGWQRALLEQLELVCRDGMPGLQGQRLADSLRRQLDDVSDLQLVRAVLVIMDWLDEALPVLEPDPDRWGACILQVLGGAAIEMTELLRSPV
jgi:hypothetical protein